MTVGASHPSARHHEIQLAALESWFAGSRLPAL